MKSQECYEKLSEKKLIFFYSLFIYLFVYLFIYLFWFSNKNNFLVQKVQASPKKFTLTLPTLGSLLLIFQNLQPPSSFKIFWPPLPPFPSLLDPLPHQKIGGAYYLLFLHHLTSISISHQFACSHSFKLLFLLFTLFFNYFCFSKTFL